MINFPYFPHPSAPVFFGVRKPALGPSYVPCPHSNLEGALYGAPLLVREKVRRSVFVLRGCQFSTRFIPYLRNQTRHP